MMEKQLLRKADIFSGAIILVVGLLIIGQAIQMPMTDSYGGVQNVWYVSPALFPLFVGSMLCLLGIMLICIALKEVGNQGMQSVLTYLKSRDFFIFLKSPDTIRFYAIVFNLFFFVFLMVPRVDFFPAAIFFLLTLFFMFYLADHANLISIFKYSIFSAILLGLFFFFTGATATLTGVTEFGGDWLILFLLLGLCILGATAIKGRKEIAVRYRNCMIIGFSAPLTVGIIFKYFLLVPMPFEGLIVQLLDMIWYADLWS